MSERERLIVVCNKCLRASCWQDRFYCDEAWEPDTGTAEVPIKRLEELALESSHYWADNHRSTEDD